LPIRTDREKLHSPNGNQQGKLDLGVPVTSLHRQLNLHKNNVKGIPSQVLSFPIVLAKVPFSKGGQSNRNSQSSQNIGEIVKPKPYCNLKYLLVPHSR